MTQQEFTGNETEHLVAIQIKKLGLIAYKPIPDRGIDLEVTSPGKSEVSLKIQVKGRGPTQTNHQFRWFQIRTTSKQRQEAVDSGLPANESWRIKVNKVDLFILVSLKYQEFWIFDKSEIEDLILACSHKYGNRKDNKERIQAEINLDIEKDGKLLTDQYAENLNNWSKISDYFNV